MTEHVLAIEQAKLTMDWRQSRYLRLCRINDTTPGAVSEEQIKEARHLYEMSKLDWHRDRGDS